MHPVAVNRPAGTHERVNSSTFQAKPAVAIFIIIRDNFCIPLYMQVPMLYMCMHAYVYIMYSFIYLDDVQYTCTDCPQHKRAEGCYLSGPSHLLQL